MSTVVTDRGISIAVPASLVSDVPHLREKTGKIGIIGRAAAIFGVEEIIVYPDEHFGKQKREIDLIVTVLSYLETPQYLRKKLFKIRSELRYAGVLPPLRSQHHPLTSSLEDLADCEIRDGVVVSTRNSDVFVDVGLKQDAFIRNVRQSVGRRVTVALKKRDGKLEGRVIKRSEIRGYWGYQVKLSKLGLEKILRNPNFDLVIGTSRYGRLIKEVYRELEDRWRNSKKVLVVFGAPSQGLYDIAKREKFNLESITDFVVNVIPNQKVETMRTEEAVHVTLGILNLFTKS